LLDAAPLAFFAPGIQPDHIRLNELRLRPSRRLGGINLAHVRVLKEIAGNWPPILVASATHTVVDGLHRVVAAQELGFSRLACTWFDGDEADAHAEFVRRNTTHGLPLTVEERQEAARRILWGHPEWSDRRVAGICALAPATVARVRQSIVQLVPGDGRSCSTDHRERLDTRVGQDGRVRPLDRRALRSRIGKALRANPDASLRQVAALVGTSPTTVRSVHLELAGHRHQDEASAAESRVVASPPSDIRRQGHKQDWQPDSATLSTNEGARFAEWFTRSGVSDEWQSYLPGVPYSRIYEVAEEARRRAAHWAEFARALEARSTQR
jgi:hypothetical protein